MFTVAVRHGSSGVQNAPAVDDNDNQVCSEVELYTVASPARNTSDSLHMWF